MLRYIFLATILLLLLCTDRASAVLVWNNGMGDGVTGYNISAAAVADDFVLDSPASFDRIRVWLSALAADMNTGGIFSGTLGWAIYADSGGMPGANLFFDSDSTITLIPDGMNGGDAEYIADIDVGAAVALPAGTYWLQLREGDFSYPPDGTNIYWSTSEMQQNALPRVNAGAAIDDLAFRLDLVAVPESGTLPVLGLLLAIIVATGIKKRYDSQLSRTASPS